MRAASCRFASKCNVLSSQALRCCRREPDRTQQRGRATVRCVLRHDALETRRAGRLEVAAHLLRLGAFVPRRLTSLPGNLFTTQVGCEALRTSEQSGTHPPRSALRPGWRVPSLRDSDKMASRLAAGSYQPAVGSCFDPEPALIGEALTPTGRPDACDRSPTVGGSLCRWVLNSRLELSTRERGLGPMSAVIVKCPATRHGGAIALSQCTS